MQNWFCELTEFWIRNRKFWFFAPYQVPDAWNSLAMQFVFFKKRSQTGNLNPIENIYPIASKASREVANLTERKNQHTPMVSNYLSVCPSVRLLQTLTPIIQGEIAQMVRRLLRIPAIPCSNLVDSFFQEFLFHAAACLGQ